MKLTFLRETPLSLLSPSGWLKAWYKTMKKGLGSHLAAAGFPFDTRLWACPDIPYREGASPWWPYEQTAYWVDGFTRLGLLLDDKALTNKAKKQFDYVLKHAKQDGYLGPKGCIPPMPAGRWSHMIFFRAMIAWQEATGDKRIIPALKKYFLKHKHDHTSHRDVCNIEIMAWLYDKTGDKKLVSLAEKTWNTFLDTAADQDLELRPEKINKMKPADCHGVTFSETVKQGAILYRITGKRKYLDYSLKGFKKIDRFHMLPAGGPSSTEYLHTTTSLDATEMCDFADYTWAAGHMLISTGDLSFADKIERAALNGFFGGVTKDFKGLQYFSSTNQVILGRNSNHTLAATGGKWMCYSPKPGTECCSSNSTRVLPGYGSRMWLMQGTDPAAILYGPSVFTFNKAGVKVSINQRTDYPFNEELDFLISPSRPISFTLHLRIPGWCQHAEISVNGKVIRQKCKAGSLAAVKQRFKKGDVVNLKLPMDLGTSRWPDKGVCLERGPLLFALPIPERRRINKKDPHQTADFPAWEMFPKGEWNYALCADMPSFLKHISVETRPVGRNPWSDPPIRLHVPARKVRGWQVRKVKQLPSIGGKLIDPARNIWEMIPHTARGDFHVTPPLPDPAKLPQKLAKTTEFICLVPIGCTLLRIGMFPSCK